MDKYNITEHYRNFKELVKKLHNNDSKKLLDKLDNLIENNFSNIIEGLLFHRFDNNIKGKKYQDGTLISFLKNETAIAKSIIVPSLLIRTKDKIRTKIKETIAKTPIFSFSTYNTSSVFKINIPIEIYANTTRNYLFYYKHDDDEVYENYVMLYQTYIINNLENLYIKPNVNRQINFDNLQLCSIDNFKKINTMDTIAFSNRDKFINKLIISIKEGKRLLSEDDISLCYKARLIHDMIYYSPKYKDKLTKETTDEQPAYIRNTQEQKEEDIKINIIKLLRNSIRQQNYNGFFTKDDYINFLCDKYSDCERDYIDWLFDNTTKPRPPVGVTRFSVRLPSNEELVYFIALENITPLFIDYQFSNKKNKKKSQMAIPQRHFLLLIKKLLEEFRMAGYSNKTISEKLICTEATIKMMDKYTKLLL